MENPKTIIIGQPTEKRATKPSKIAGMTSIAQNIIASSIPTTSIFIQSLIPSASSSVYAIPSCLLAGNVAPGRNNFFNMTASLRYNYRNILAVRIKNTLTVFVKTTSKAYIIFTILSILRTPSWSPQPYAQNEMTKNYRLFRRHAYLLISLFYKFPPRSSVR